MGLCLSVSICPSISSYCAVTIDIQQKTTQLLFFLLRRLLISYYIYFFLFYFMFYILKIIYDIIYMYSYTCCEKKRLITKF